MIRTGRCLPPTHFTSVFFSREISLHGINERSERNVNPWEKLLPPMALVCGGMMMNWMMNWSLEDLLTSAHQNMPPWEDKSGGGDTWPPHYCNYN